MTNNFIESSTSKNIDDFSAQSKYIGTIRARELIISATRKKNFISSVYRETLKSIIQIFSDYSYLNSEGKSVPIKCIHSNPERTIAKLKQETNIILPIISVSQTTSNSQLERRKYDALIIQEKVWDEKKQRAYRVVSLAPKEVTIIYTINVWSKYKSDLDQITEQIRLEFNPAKRVATPFNQYTKAFLADEADDSTSVVSDREERLLRKVFTVEVETYIPTPKFLMTSTGKIEEWNYEVISAK
jgi:hypothetical protein